VIYQMIDCVLEAPRLQLSARRHRQHHRVCDGPSSIVSVAAKSTSRLLFLLR
jgi:hypothetical protein